MSGDIKSGISRRGAVLLTAGMIAAPSIAARSLAVADSGDKGFFGPGRNHPFDLDWKFHRGGLDGAEHPQFVDAAWRTIDLPHDWSIEDLPADPGATRIGPFDKAAPGETATAFTLGGEGWYRKRFVMMPLPAGGRVRINFGGAYMESDVWLNGHFVGRKVHGYTPFSYDLTPYLSADGHNMLAVRVRNHGKTSRWYSGSGIYRSVTLDVLTDASHITPWGVAVVTRRITDRAANIDVETQIEQPSAELILRTRIKDAAGRELAAAVTPASARVKQSLKISNPPLWSPDSPALCTVETELCRGSRIIDHVTTPLGIRIVSFDANHGMSINGKRTKLRGACIHHDNGLLGAAAHADAEERKVLLLKARGFNAIRSAHNPASEAFIDACDRHGMLLIQEAFDMWFTGKNPDDYARYFDEHSHDDLSAMILGSRNHPAIIMWSIGNEIPDRSSAKGVEVQWRLANLARTLDPSRPATAAINSFAGRKVIPDANTARPGFAGIADETSSLFLDVVGYNYKLDLYAGDHVKFPQRIVYGSESFPGDVFKIWKFAEDNSFLLGDFVWAGMDYLGEAGLGGVTRSTAATMSPLYPAAWPWIVSGCGDIDLIGMQRAQSRARDVAWGISPIEMEVQRPLPDGEKEHLSYWAWSDEAQSWTWPGAEGRPLKVRIYTRAERVELRLNGKIISTLAGVSLENLPIEFSVPYHPGTLEAIAYRGNAEIGRRMLTTAGPARAIRLNPEPRADGTRKGLYFVHIAVVDEAGQVVPYAASDIKVSVEGPAKLVALGSASPFATGSFQANSCATYNGHALAIIRGTRNAGSSYIRASSPSLDPAVAQLG